MELRKVLENETVADVGYRRPVLARLDATVAQALAIMQENAVGCILIVEGDDLRGIFTERDALNRVLAEARDPDSTPLSDVMTVNLVTLGPRAAAIDALRLMSDVGIRHLPVVEEDDVHGIISLRDFVGAEFQQA